MCNIKENLRRIRLIVDVAFAVMESCLPRFNGFLVQYFVLFLQFQ